jgi:hypothetical protein
MRQPKPIDARTNTLPVETECKGYSKVTGDAGRPREWDTHIMMVGTSRPLDMHHVAETHLTPFNPDSAVPRWRTTMPMTRMANTRHPRGPQMTQRQPDDAGGRSGTAGQQTRMKTQDAAYPQPRREQLLAGGNGEH